MLEVIKNRRSIRKYADKPVEKEKIDTMLRAGMQAPSARNQQAWEFIVVQDKDNLKELSETSPYGGMTANAGVAIVVLGNEDNITVPGMWEQDLGAATQNILLQAADLGLGAVWIGICPSRERMSNISKMFNLSDNLKPFAILSIGYPAEGQENRFVDRFDASKVHYEKY